MSTDRKVLTFPKSSNNSPKGAKSGEVEAEVVDISVQRQKMIEAERRSVKRTILTEFVGAHIVIPGKGLHKCAIFDISEKGLAFDLEKNHGQIRPGEVVAMRVYLNYKTYFGFTVTVNNSRFVDEDGVFRHGTSLHEDTINEQALHHFVSFIENVSASLKTDNGDVVVSNLDSK